MHACIRHDGCDGVIKNEWLQEIELSAARSIYYSATVVRSWDWDRLFAHRILLTHTQASTRSSTTTSVTPKIPTTWTFLLTLHASTNIATLFHRVDVRSMSSRSKIQIVRNLLLGTNTRAHPHTQCQLRHDSNKTACGFRRRVVCS